MAKASKDYSLALRFCEIAFIRSRHPKVASSMSPDSSLYKAAELAMNDIVEAAMNTGNLHYT